MHYIVLQSVHGLKVGTELAIELPVHDSLVGPDPETVAANLLGGALDIHATPRAGGKGELDLVFEATGRCGCFGGPADPGEVVACVKVPGRTTGERKTRLATALLRGQLATALLPWFAVEPTEDEDDAAEDQDAGEKKPDSDKNPDGEKNPDVDDSWPDDDEPPLS